MSKFDELKKLAEAAEPGPWGYKEDKDDGSYYVVSIKNILICGSDGYDQHPPGSNDTEFIAAANPAAILELLAIQAQLVEALKGLDDSFCSINEFSTKEERHQARMNLIAARAAVAAAEVKP